MEKGIASPSSAAILLAIVGIIFTSRDYDGAQQTVSFKDYKVSFYTYILGGKNVVVSSMIYFCHLIYGSQLIGLEQIKMKIQIALSN